MGLLTQLLVTDPAASGNLFKAPVSSVIAIGATVAGGVQQIAARPIDIAIYIESDTLRQTPQDIAIVKTAASYDLTAANLLANAAPNGYASTFGCSAIYGMYLEYQTPQTASMAALAFTLAAENEFGAAISNIFNFQVSPQDQSRQLAKMLVLPSIQFNGVATYSPMIARIVFATAVASSAPSITHTAAPPSNTTLTYRPITRGCADVAHLCNELTNMRTRARWSARDDAAAYMPVSRGSAAAASSFSPLAKED